MEKESSYKKLAVAQLVLCFGSEIIKFLWILTEIVCQNQIERSKVQFIAISEPLIGFLH